MRNRGVIHRGDARIGIYFRRQLVGSDRRDSGRSGLGQTGVLDAGSAPQARRSQCARAVAAGLGARSGRFVAARRGSLGAYGSGRRTDRRLAQRSSASIVRISGGGRSGDVAGQDAGLLLSMAGPGSSDFRWQLRQQARQQRHGLAGARGLRSGRGRLQPFRADGQARRRSARPRSRHSRRNPARRPQLFERQGFAALARERRQDRRRRLSGPAALEFAASAGADDKKFDLAEHLRNMPADKLTDDLVVRIEGAGAPMRTRIVIRRKSEEAAQAERQRLLSQARKKGKTLDPRSLLAAGFVVLATSLDAETYPADELLAMYRLRWQIELAFKRLKSLLNLDRLPARTEKGARSWIWAHLILAIATDDYSQDFLDSSPSGPARRPIRPVDLARPEDRHPAITRSSPGTHRHRMPQNRLAQMPANPLSR